MTGGFVAMAALGLASPGVADPLPQTISPLLVQQDHNAVNLLTGRTTPDALVLSVPADPRLKFDLTQNAAPYSKSDVTKNWDTGNEVTAVSSVHTAEGTTEGFQCNLDATWGKVCDASLNGTGSMLNFGATSFRKGGSGELYAFTDVDEYTMPARTDQDQKTHKVFYASKVTYPDGEVISYTYGYATISSVATEILHRPIKLSSNRGYYISINYGCDDPTQTCWYVPTDAAIYAANAPNVPLARYTYNSDGSVTDLAGRIYHGYSPGAAAANLEIEGYSRTLPNDSTPAIVVNPASGLTMIGSVVRDGVQWNYTYANPTFYDGINGYLYDSVTVSGPDGYHKVYAMAHTSSLSPVGSRNLLASVTDEKNNTTTYNYDTVSVLNGSDVRLVKVTMPEGNATTVKYDDAGNVILKTTTAKPGSGLSDLVEQAFVDLSPYTDGGGYIDCLGTVACYRPTWYKDALQRETDFRYNANGQLTKQLSPMAGGYQLTLISYVPSPAGISRKSEVKVCKSSSAAIDTAACSGTADSDTLYTYWGDTDLPLTVTQKDEAASATRTTAYAYDSAGRVTMIDGPLPGTDDARYFRYDALGRKLLEVGELAPNGLRLATISRYRDSDDKVIGTVSGTMACTTACDTSSALMTVLQQTDATYDSRRNPVRAITYKGTTIYSVTDSSFLDRGLAECSAVRMNLDRLPAISDHGACSPGTEGANGADRITKNSYDAAGQLTLVQKAYGTALQANYAAYAYTANGKQQYVTDANGNKAAFVYDGFDRQSQWQFPSKTVPGTVNTTDYEQYGYDAAGNRTSLRKRDGSILTFAYDGLDRVLSKTISTSRVDLTASQKRPVYYLYDSMGRQTAARFDSTSGDGTTNSYNGFGELTHWQLGMNGYGRSMSASFDVAGRRTQVIIPNVTLNYTFDALGRMTSLSQGTTLLDTFTYASNGLVSNRSEGASAASSVAYTWDDIGRLTGQSDAFSGSIGNISRAFGYNPASQIAADTKSNASYAFPTSQVGTVNRDYGVNGLNQYTSTSSSGTTTASFSYDANGNLISDGTHSYTYDVENRLVQAVSGGVTTTLTYDPVGRLYEVVKGSSDTRFFYDGDAMVAEYDAAGIALNRYVHGSNAVADDPLVWYEGSGLSSPHWLHADHLGSIVALTDSSGANPTINTYDEYGINGAANNTAERFGYTGQAYIPELGLYYYKARFYSPSLGRFLQTDPIGYKDQINLYGYVGDNPTNEIDPSGLCNKDRTLCLADNPSREQKKTISNSPADDKAMHDNKGKVQVRSGSDEKLGFIKNDGTFRVPGDEKTDSTNDQDNASGTLGPADHMVLHGHTPNDDGVVDDTEGGRGMGDAQPLTRGVTNGTVTPDARVGVHEVVNGQLQFRMIDGRMTREEANKMQRNINAEQKLWDKQHD